MTMGALESPALHDRRLLRRLRAAMLATVLLTGLATTGLYATAAVYLGAHRAAVEERTALERMHRLAVGLSAAVQGLSRTAAPVHAMVARSQVLAARRELATAAGGLAPEGGQVDGLDTVLRLAARIGNAPDGAQRARDMARLEKAVAGPLAREIERRLAAARARGEALLVEGRVVGGLLAGAGVLLLWLNWRIVIAPGCLKLERRTAQLRRAARRISRRMLHDGLTGLANRRYLTRQLDGRDPEGELAVLHLDIDNFRALNADSGRDFGDRVLCYVADTLSELAMLGETVARLDADAFALATRRRTHPSQLQELAVEILRALESRTAIDGQALSLSAVIGIAARESSRDTVESLLAAAELACARARKEGGAIYFSEAMGARLTARRRTAQELLQGLMRDEIEPFFQPQVETGTGRVIGFEALARWRHPDGSVLSPYFFMDIAHDARLSQRVTNTMLAKSLAALVAWRDAGLEVPRIGVNVTLRELRDPDFHDRLVFDLERHGLGPEDLGIEILESALIDADDDPVLDSVARLSASGFAIDLDDFGTGHASLSNLQRLAVDRIKIDRAFVRDLPTRPDQRKVTLAMIQLARSLGITALAEGIETDDERRLMAELGCPQMQGFAIGRPMAAGDVPGWLGAGTRGEGAPPSRVDSAA